MSLDLLLQKVQDRSARLAVIGLGYVGLPVAALFAEAGYDVLGVEIRRERVENINRGVSPIEGNEPGMETVLAEVVARGSLRATVDYQELADRDIILIDVETPVDDRHIPRYDALSASLKSLQAVLKTGALVIVESTIAPQTMKNLVCPLLENSGKAELNRDFYLGNCPERVMPGKLLANLRSLSRVVGGGSAETAAVMVALYRTIVQADLDPVDWITAELVKTTENAYRDVQIAFANEVALICEELGADIWKVRELVNKSPFRAMHLPGAGVGGHCIPKDPWLLAYGVTGTGLDLHIVPTARGVNDSMPFHMVDLAEKALAGHGKTLAGSRILVMGFAYLEDSDDTRNSPSEVLVNCLKQKGAEVVIHDPYVAEYQGDLAGKATGCDAAIVMVRHSDYTRLEPEFFLTALKHPVVVDGRRVFEANKFLKAGVIYRGLGQAVSA